MRERTRFVTKVELCECYGVSRKTGYSSRGPRERQRRGLDSPCAWWCDRASMRRTIGEIAAFVTSKNAGPFLLTLDIVFPDRTTYERFKALKALDRVTVAGLYGVMAEDVLKIIEFDPAYAVKITMRRPVGSGALGESDVYGAQQHVPLMEHAVAWEDA